MGGDALKIVQTLSDDDQKKLRKDVTELFTFFENRFKPEANTILASFQFCQMKRGKLTSDDFMSSLQSKARECGYTDAGRQIREQFTVMIDDTKMQDELLAKLSDTSTPDDALKITCKIEAQRQQKSAIQQEQKEFNAVHRGHGGNRGGHGQDRGQGRGRNGSRYRSQSNDGCRYCGKCHPPKQCPAWGKECRKCGKKNHFENKCRSDRSQSHDTNKKLSRGKKPMSTKVQRQEPEVP